MVVVLSLLTAAAFGAADFAGGLATQRTRVVEVIAGSHLVGLVGVSGAALVLADAFSARDFGLGVVAGAFGGAGIFFLYRRLAIGPMSIVAPLTAVTSAVVPLVSDVVRGESFSTLTWVGIAVAIVAIVLISTGDDGAADAPVTARVVFESLLAGLGFGTFFFFVDLTDQAHAPWPIVGARILTVVVVGGLVLARPQRIQTSGRSTIWLIAVAGALDTTSNTLFLYATTIGDLGVVSVLSSLYPVATLALAAIVLHERIPVPQRIGVALALAATMAIAAG